MKMVAISEFLDDLNKRFGIYLDTVQGFISNHRWLLQSQEKVQRQHGLSIEQQDAAFMIEAIIRRLPDSKNVLEEKNTG